MRRVAALAALALIAVSPALAAVPPWHEVARASQTGGFLVVAATAHVTGPSAIEVVVATRPRGRVGGNTLLRCDGRSAHGHVHGPTPLARQLGLPVPRPHDCDVVVNISFAARGRVTVTVFAR